MKIAIYDDGTIDRRGGGFTFKNEIINGIENLNINSNDQYYLFSWKSFRNTGSNHHLKNMKRIAIQEPILLMFLEFIKRSLHQALKSIFFRLRKENRKAIINPSINAMNLFSKIRSRILERELLSCGINLIIYMEAQEILTCKIPFICISWDIGHLYAPFFPETNFENWELFEKLKSRALKRAVHIVVGTDIGKEQIHSQYRIPRNRISVIPFPTPIYLLSEKSKNLNNNHTSFDPENDFLLYPANYWPHKNHFLLIKAMRSLIIEKKMDIRLVLCGSDKGNKRFIKNLINEYQLNDHIYTFDFLERGELNFLYSKAFAMVFPSFMGPDNLPPLEAFGLGCPVIAAAVEGAQEQLSNNALLFDPFNPDDLMDKIIYLKNNKKIRDELIKKGIEKAGSWTSDDYVKSLISKAEKYRPYSRCFDLRTYRSMFS